MTIKMQKRAKKCELIIILLRCSVEAGLRMIKVREDDEL